MSTTICFTQGHISIRRGRVTRQYRNPTLTSIRRLSNLTFYGAADGHTTQRSSIYEWHGLSTLTRIQRKAFEFYKVEAGMHIDYAYKLGIYDTCLQIGIPQRLLNTVTLI